MLPTIPGSARVSWKNDSKQSPASIIFFRADITFQNKISLEIEIITIILLLKEANKEGISI
jgi:hypothetical protein